PEIPEISLNVSEEESRQAEAKLRTFGSQVDAVRIAVGAGASYGSAKCWPPERFAKAINRLLKERKAEVILFGTPAEAGVSAAMPDRSPLHDSDCPRESERGNCESIGGGVCWLVTPHAGRLSFWIATAR